MSLFSGAAGAKPGAKAVVFDLDGTLVDSAPDLHAAATVLLAERGQDALDLATITSFVGNGVPVLVERVLRRVGESPAPAELEAAVARFGAIYGAAPSALSRPYPGVREALAALSGQGLTLGVCTNKPEAPARHLLADLGLGGFFAGLVGGDSLAERKPHPAPLRHLAKLLGAGEGAVVYVGDSEVDAATAAAAEIPFVLFTEGYRKTPIEEIPHQARFDAFSELPDLLNGQSADSGPKTA